MTTHAPGPDELRSALAAAEEMRVEGNDPRHIAKSLRYLYSRCQGLEELLQITDRFLRFGMPEHELSEIRRLVDHLRENESGPQADHAVERTLPI